MIFVSQQPEIEVDFGATVIRPRCTSPVATSMPTKNPGTLPGVLFWSETGWSAVANGQAGTGAEGEICPLLNSACRALQRVIGYFEGKNFYFSLLHCFILSWSRPRRRSCTTFGTASNATLSRVKRA